MSNEGDVAQKEDVMKKIIYIIIAVLVLLVASVGPGYSDRGGHGRAGLRPVLDGGW